MLYPVPFFAKRIFAYMSQDIEISSFALILNPFNFE